MHCCSSCEGSPKIVCYTSGPATVREGLCSATVAVAQPFSVLYERFHKIQQPCSCWQLCVSPLSGPCENDLKPHLILATGQASHTQHVQNLLHAAESLMKDNWFSTSQEIPHILWNTKVPYRVYKNPPPVPTPSHINQGNNY
jgi:hypothetical protein